MDVLTPSGDYADRIRVAIAANAVMQAQWHINSGGGHYALVEVNEAASSGLKACAAEIAGDFAHVFGIGAGDVRVLYPGDRGHGCLGSTLPGMVLEPAFGDVADQAALLRTLPVQDMLAQIFARRVRQHYPENATISDNLGHRGKTSSPDDRGAAMAPDGTPNDGDDWEADVIAAAWTRSVELLRGGVVFTYYLKVLACTSVGQAKAMREYLTGRGMQVRCQRIGSVLVFHANSVKMAWAKGRCASRGVPWGSEPLPTTQASYKLIPDTETD